MQLFQEKYWAIDFGFAKRIEPLVAAGKLDMLEVYASKSNPKDKPFEQTKLAVNLTEDEFWEIYGLNVSFESDVMVLPIVGATTPHGEACTVSTAKIEKALKIASAKEDIKGVLLYMDTPGGAVTGMSRLAAKIKEFKKPIGTLVEGMMCSGGVYTAAHTDFIFVEDANSTTLGSIGVLQVLVDETAALEKAGIKVTINRGPKSSNKARGNSLEGYTDEMIAEETKVLGKIEADFHKVVRAGRPGISDQIFADEAKVYTGGEAIKLGLADKLANMAEAINTLLGMNGKRKKYKNGYGF